MDRRTFLAAVATLPAIRAYAANADLKDAARTAWLYCLPLIEMASTRQALLRGGSANRMTHRRILSDPGQRQVTAPNNDTLASSGWFDLTQGPVTLTVPDAGNRYLAVQLLDMYTNTNACVNKRNFRTAIEGGGTFTLVGPGQQSDGPNPIEMATPHGWALARTLTTGGDDLAAAHALQDRIVLAGPAISATGQFARRDAGAVDFFTSAAELMRSDPPPMRDHKVMASLASIGVAPGRPFDAGSLSPAAIGQIEAGIAAARNDLAASATASKLIDGWFYPPANLGNFGEDYRFRAIVALVGLAANTPEEAIYLQAEGEHGRLFSGDGLYHLRLPGPAPVDAFWSLTMYEATPEGQLFLTENAINRYSIGDRTNGLRSNPDNSIDIWIGRSDPGGERSANWLPAPTTGPFTLTFRAYWPRSEFLDGHYRLPRITRMSA